MIYSSIKLSLYYNFLLNYLLKNLMQLPAFRQCAKSDIINAKWKERNTASFERNPSLPAFAESYQSSSVSSNC